MDCFTLSHSPMQISRFALNNSTKLMHQTPISNSNYSLLKPSAFIESQKFHPLPSFSAKLQQLRKPRLLCRAVDNLLDNEDPSDDYKEDEDESVSLDDQIVEQELENVDNVILRIEKLGKNSRRISATIEVDAPLDAVWNVLTDYERLADFIPGLAVSQLLERRENGARLLQIGQQNLAFGLKFKAKGIVDVYENELEILPLGIQRDIDFKMVEGDFQVFEGKWRIEQVEGKAIGNLSFLDTSNFRTLLSYIVDVQPRIWLPVALVEGRLSNEIQINLTCVRNKVLSTAFDALPIV